MALNRHNLVRLLLLAVAVVLLAVAAKPSLAPPRTAAEDAATLKRDLDALLSGLPGRYGIWYRDLVTGAEVGINQNDSFPAASCTKVPTVLYLNELVAQGRMKWTERVTYRADEDYQEGDGVLRYSAVDGATYSVRTLANLSITLSDNVAHRMLLRHLGKENVAGFMRSLGAKVVYPDGRNVTTPREMGIYMMAVLDFARRNPEDGNRLLDDLANSIWHVGIPGALPPDLRVSHKEGEITGVANDAGIVFTDPPYVLVVLSEGVRSPDEGFRAISRISRIVYDYHRGASRGTLTGALPEG